MSMKPIKIGTHDGRFHTDEIFAIAVIKLMYKMPIVVCRTRDPKILAEMDFIIDVGGVFDNERFFDHHQTDFASVRANSKIPYATFGLLWNRFGRDLCSSEVVFEYIDNRVVIPVDAFDNGKNVAKINPGEIKPYCLHSAVQSFHPLKNETEADVFPYFMDLIDFAEKILKREIARAEQINNEEILGIENCIRKSANRVIVLLDGKYEYTVVQMVMKKYKEAKFAIAKSQTDQWRVIGIQDRPFEPRVNLPKSWAGKEKKEFQEITGVADAEFCHRNMHIAAAWTQEGAFKLAELALIHAGLNTK